VRFFGKEREVRKAENRDPWSNERRCVLANKIGSDNDTAKCACKGEEVVLLPCSGGSNCGQIANQVAVKLTEEGVGKIYCLAGIGAHIQGMIETARSAKRIVALDGCQVACARKAIEHAGLVVTDWVCVTEEGIAKNHDFDLPPEHIAVIAQRTRESLARTPKLT
jgi:uncharacterized metal-binding protein